MPDVAGVHDDEPAVEPGRRATTRSPFGCGVIATVSTQFGITITRSGGAPFAISRSRIRSPIATTSVRPPEVEADERTGAAATTSGFVSRPSSVAISGKTSSLITSSGTRLRTRDQEAEIADDRGIRHAEHEVGPADGVRADEAIDEIRDVVHRAETELRPVERRRACPQHEHPVQHLPRRKVGAALEPSGDDGDVELLGERLAEVGEQVRGRLDPRLVVLVENEDARSAVVSCHRRQATAQRFCELPGGLAELLSRTRKVEPTCRRTKPSGRSRWLASKIV